MRKDNEVPESIISYVLIGGLVVSVAIEVVGILAYYAQSGGLAFDFSLQWQVTGQSFFSYIVSLIDSIHSIQAPIVLMALGIVLLMLTSYTHVFATLLYFAFYRNPKYTLISLFLFAFLTFALLGFR